MKIAAIIDEFNEINENHKSFIKKARTQSRADLLIAIMSGDFLQQGLPACHDKYTRAQAVVDAGVDLVIELPVYCTLASPDTYAFAAVSMLESLHCVSELYIACDTPQTDILSQVAQFLFMETKPYQDGIKKRRTQGMTFYEAQADAVGEHIPGAHRVLQNPVNIFAAEYLRALKRMYSRIKPVCIQAPGLSPLIKNTTGTEENTYLSSLVHYSLYDIPWKMDEISGGTSMLTRRILEIRSQYTNFNDFCTHLTTPTRSLANIRRYMLSLAFHIRKADMAICRLYSFALYLRMIGIAPAAKDTLDTLKKQTWTPLFADPAIDAVHTPKPELDLALGMLDELDERAHKLYTLAFS